MDMSLLFPFFSALKKKVLRYLLNRYMGQFLEEKLTLDQLSVDFIKGTGTVKDVTLQSQSLNELCESQGWNIEVVGGHIGCIEVSIPWNAMMSEDSHFIVSNLCITLRPIARGKDGTSVLESMWSSMSSSMQLAQDCIENENLEMGNSAQQSNVMEGLERVAQTIDNVLNRIKARLIDTEIRLEYVTPGSNKGIVLTIKIKSLEYRNEAGSDPPCGSSAEKANDEKNKCTISTYSTHHVKMEGITFYTEEFRIERSDPKRQETQSPDMNQDNEQFLSTISDLPEVKLNYSSNSTIGNESDNESESSAECDDDSHSSEVMITEQVMLAQLSGTQEIRIQMKQTDDVPGPMVQLEVTLGALNFFVSPRQLHLLTLFGEVFLKYSQTSASDKSRMQDEFNVQIDLNKLHKLNVSGMGLKQGGQGWSNDPLADNNLTNVFMTHSPLHQLRYERYGSSTGFADSTFSSNASMTSSMTSSMSVSTQNTTHARKRGIIAADPNADISKLNIRISSCLIVLLHEEILVESSEGCPLTDQSVFRLKQIADKYFSTTATFSMGYGVNDFVNAGELLKESCSSNHLRLLLTPVIIDGEQQRNASGNLLKLTVSIARADFREVLSDQTVPIIEFIREDMARGLPASPEITVNVKQITHSLRGSGGKRLDAPKTEINFSLSPCTTEIDISALDRLHALFNASPFLVTNVTDPNSINGSKSSKLNVKLDCQTLDVRLRFPIADLRPLHDSDRPPWWKRNVRDDFLLFNLIQMRLSFVLPAAYIVEANELNVYYCEHMKSEKIHMAKASLVEKPALKFAPPTIEYPRISLEIPQTTSIPDPMQCRSSDDSDGSQDNIGFAKPKEQTPFSSKRVCRESDTPHSKQSSEETETLLMPGDKTEMDNFCQDTMKSSKIQIKIQLPVVSLQIKSKHLYEVIYNRFNSDLLLWAPSAPRKPSAPYNQCNTNTLLNVGMMDSIYEPFTLCNTDIDFESSSATNSESEMDSDSVVYHSAYENKRFKRSISKLIATDKTSAVSFQLIVDHGMLTMYSPVRDSLNHVIPGQLGEFVIKCNSAVLFSTNGYHGNENLAYVCLQVKSAEVYHFGLTPVPSSNPPLRSINCVLPSHLYGTLYPTPKGISLCSDKGATNREMIGIALQLKSFPDQKIKKIKVAAGIQKTTLRHFTVLQEHMWLTQIIDMLDVTDYAVQGYTSMGVVTEMHLHLWDTSIDYRPINFNYRSIISVGSFVLSSNITTASTGLTLRFIAEGCIMCLAPYSADKDKKNKKNTLISVLPATELVCVLDLELFEISLRLNDKATASFPKFDLRTTVNGVHLRTCSDSAEALAKLITYLANEGDLISDYVDSEETKIPNNEELLSTKTTRSHPEITAIQHERIASLMEDAMQESVQLVPEMPDEPNEDHDNELFFFPDETIQYSRYDRSKTNTPTLRRSVSLTESQRSLEDTAAKAISERSEDSFRVHSEMRDLDFDNSMIGLKTTMETEVTEELPQVATELGNISRPQQVKSKPRRVSSDMEDGFCIIAHEEKPRCRYEDVETTADSIQIVDSHFNPPGKQDPLKAPENFPMAVVRYTVCEMTVTWQLFGGYDFPKPSDKPTQSPPKSTTIKSRQQMSEAYKTGVSYSKGTPGVSFGTGTSGSHRKFTWKEQGGANRRHDILMEFYVNKVKFCHETYPSDKKKASRQVLLVTDLEIRDRLAVSKYNKFLYHKRTSQPQINSKHMLVVNAVHLRPDRPLARQECDLMISLLPLHLHIDQDSLTFMVDFFTNIGSTGNNDTKGLPQRRHSSPSHQPPVMMVDIPVPIIQDQQARQMVSENLMWLLNEEQEQNEAVDNTTMADDDTPIFFRRVCFQQVLINLDYAGKHFVLDRGPLAGLLMGLGQLQCSEIRLKGINYKKGILGIDKLLKMFQEEWLEDIRNNQLASVLRGLGPMNTFVELVQGVFDLFWLPIEQYKKDGRIIRGIQLGAQSFTARTALAALEITTRLIQLLQITAETAYDMVSPGPSVRRLREMRYGKRNRKRMHPPQDIREGVNNAYTIVKEGFGDTAQTLADVATSEHDRKGYSGAFGALIRQIPPTVVKPIVLATQATTNVLGGVRNQLVPDARRDAKEKWKDDDD